MTIEWSETPSVLRADLEQARARIKSLEHGLAVIQAETMRPARTEFLAARVAYHLAHGCDTAERARELALAEWDVGVMGVRR